MNSNEPDTDLVDLRFVLQGTAVSLDYADALASALSQALPWFSSDPEVGVHPLVGLSAGEGGWYLSGRSRLTLRLPRLRLDEAKRLSGMALQVGEHLLHVGAASERDLPHASVVYAHFVTFGIETGAGIADESRFFARCREELNEMSLTPRLVCGKFRQASVAGGVVSGFSLMVSDLDVAGTLRLQQRGLGQERKRGCGIFIPHKSMAPVATLE